MGQATTPDSVLLDTDAFADAQFCEYDFGSPDHVVVALVVLPASSLAWDTSALVRIADVEDFDDLGRRLAQAGLAYDLRPSDLSEGDVWAYWFEDAPEEEDMPKAPTFRL